jgi:hypothetical protein
MFETSSTPKETIVRTCLPVLLLLVAPIPGLISAGDEKVLLVDNFDGDGPKLGNSWETYADDNKLGTKLNPFVMEKGGSPKSGKGHAHFSGHMGKFKDPWPWALVELDFGADGPKDLSGYNSLRFYAKGDGKKYRVRLGRAAVEDYCHFEYAFVAPKEWTLITCAMDQFAQPKWGKQIAKGFKDVTSIGFMALAPGNDESFDLRFDDVEFVTGTPANKK